MRSSFANVFALIAAVLVLAVGGPWLIGTLRTLPHPARLAARADQRIATLEISGMTCKGCAKAVEQGLAGTPGVSAVEVRLGQDRAYVVCDKTLPDSALVRAVEQAGPSFLAAMTRP